VIVTTGGLIVVGGDIAVWRGELDEPQQGQARCRLSGFGQAPRLRL